MEVASLISSFWRRNLGTIDINLENAFGQQYSLLSLIMKKSKTLGFKHLNYSHTIYYILLRHIVHVLLPIIHISLYIIGASISIVLAYKDNGWNNAVVLNISVYICSLQGLLSEQTKNKSGIAICRLIVKFVTDLFYERRLDPISYHKLAFLPFPRMCLSDLLSQGQRPEGAAGAPRAEDAARGKCSDGKRMCTRTPPCTHMKPYIDDTCIIKLQ